MKVQCQSQDRISTLPQDTVEKILSLMPIRDSIRTSILSRKWRYSWTGIPKLVFDDKLANESFDMDDEHSKCKLVSAMFHVLLLHKGPISELHISIAETEFDNEIDPVILQLSLSKNIKNFIFEIEYIDEYYKLPCSFFSLQGLEHLSLTRCELQLPLMFNGFSMLKGLALYEVKITANMLQLFLTSCPLLEDFTLSGCHKTSFTGGNKFTFVELFECLPSIQVVNISRIYIKHLAAGEISQKLPTSIVYLRILVLEVGFHRQKEISSTLCVINSSPNLKKIKITMVNIHNQTWTTLLEPQEYSGLKLDHLEELEITYFHNYAPEMEFLKLFIAKSPLLKKARIKLSISVSVDEENKMLRDLLNLPFPRASPAIKFIIERLENNP